VLDGHLRIPPPRGSGALTRVIRVLWTMPTNLLGHAAGLIVSGRLPSRVGGAAAVGWLYPIRSGLGLDWVGAVTLGHAILHRPGMLDTATLGGRLTLAHELCHTRQHDRLGPLYLPLHIVGQAVSALLSLGRAVVVSRVHDHNPLEQTFIAISASATRGPLPPTVRAADLQAAFGL
jgi:hypothetical protein